MALGCRWRWVVYVGVLMHLVTEEAEGDVGDEDCGEDEDEGEDL